MTSSVNKFTDEALAEIDKKLPNMAAILSGELTEWQFEDVGIEYAVGSTLVYKLTEVAKNSEDTLDEQLSNALHFMANNLVHYELVEVAVGLLKLYNITDDELSNVKNNQKVLDKVRSSPYNK